MSVLTKYCMSTSNLFHTCRGTKDMSKPEVIRSPTFNTFKLHLIENLTRYHKMWAFPLVD